jgi:hypothetical protein
MDKDYVILTQTAQAVLMQAPQEEAAWLIKAIIQQWRNGGEVLCNNAPAALSLPAITALGKQAELKALLLEKHERRVNAGRLGGKKKHANASTKATQEEPSVPVVEEIPLAPTNAPTRAEIKPQGETPAPPPPPAKEVAPKAKPTPASRFLPPTVDEVREYIKEKGYAFDAEAFCAFYESKGWFIGKNKMKSWRAACTTWAKSDRGKNFRSIKKCEYLNNKTSDEMKREYGF